MATSLNDCTALIITWRLAARHRRSNAVGPMPLEPGDKAPHFALLDQHGEASSLSKSLKERMSAHLAYFYP